MRIPQKVAIPIECTTMALLPAIGSNSAYDDSTGISTRGRVATALLILSLSLLSLFVDTQHMRHTFSSQKLAVPQLVHVGLDKNGNTHPSLKVPLNALNVNDTETINTTRPPLSSILQDGRLQHVRGR